MEKKYALSVVMVNKGYPNKFKKNSIIKNLNLINEDQNTKVFHSGTTLDNQNNIVASGGRVLAVTSFGKDFKIDVAPEHKSKSLFETVYNSASTPIVGLGEELKYNFSLSIII